MKTIPRLIFALSLVHICIAEDFTLTDGTKYQNVSVKRVEPDGIVIMTDDGIEKLPFAKLPPEVQTAHGFNSAEAEAYKKQQQKIQSEAYAKAEQEKKLFEQKVKQRNEEQANQIETAKQQTQPTPELKGSPQSGLSEHPSLMGTALTGADIYANMFDLENHIIKISFPSSNPKQISKEYFSLNYGSGNQVAVVLLPSEIAKRYFAPKSNATLPRTLFVKVQIGELTNEFGAKEQGPILLGVGSKIHRGMSGAAEFEW